MTIAAKPRWRTLVDAEDLARQLGTADWTIVDCRFSLGDAQLGPRLYQRSRIPGALYAHLEHDLAAPVGASGGRHPLPAPAAFAARVAAWGITPGMQVVVYDDSFGSIAARLWWMLRWIGHGDVAVLDGGWPAWKRLKLPVDETPAAVVAAPSKVRAPYPFSIATDAVVDATVVEAIRSDPGWRLIDARPEERYSGEREPIDVRAGHIPGSRNRSFEDNLAFDGRLLAADELRADFLARLGGVPPQRVVHTCGSGVTACHNRLAMEHAGLPGGRLYAGSWSDWISDPRRAVALGGD